MQRITEFIKTLTGERRLPKSVRSILSKHGDKPITNIEVFRTPISAGARLFSNIISGGKFSKVEKEYYDKFFHLYAILTLDDGTQLLYEKNQSPVLWTSIPATTKETESKAVSGNNIPLAQFVQKHIDRMGMENYMTYDPLSLNCQNFILNGLKANGLSTSAMESFVMQDLTKLIEETPSFSKWLAKKLTDVAGAITNPLEELVYRRGGKVSRRTRRVGQF